MSSEGRGRLSNTAAICAFWLARWAAWSQRQLVKDRRLGNVSHRSFRVTAAYGRWPSRAGHATTPANGGEGIV